MKIINWDIVSHPLNWVTLFLMVFFFGVILHFVLGHYQMLQLGGSLSAASNTGPRGPASYASAA
jgi:hypothetical protein